jgi:hypothetical protein
MWMWTMAGAVTILAVCWGLIWLQVRQDDRWRAEMRAEQAKQAAFRRLTDNP